MVARTMSAHHIPIINIAISVALHIPLPKWVKGGGAEDARARCAYHPKLSVKADIPARQPSARNRLMQCSKPRMLHAKHNSDRFQRWAPLASSVRRQKCCGTAP